MNGHDLLISQEFLHQRLPLTVPVPIESLSLRLNLGILLINLLLMLGSLLFQSDFMALLRDVEVALHFVQPLLESARLLNKRILLLCQGLIVG